MRQQVSAGAVVFRREPDGAVKFLLLYHGKGYWYFPKGQLEQGERAMAAFLREVEEETGLRRDELRIVPGFRAQDRFVFHVPPAPDRRRHRRRKPWAGGPVSKIVIIYLAETHQRLVRLIGPREEGFAWFTPAEAMRAAKFQSTRRIIQQAHEFIQRHLRRHPAHPGRPGGHLR